MENPFEIIIEKLNRIELLLSNLNSTTEQSSKSNLLNVSKLSEFLGLSRSTIYKLTMGRRIPYFKRGKFIYFDEEEIIEWIKLRRVKTIDEIEGEALNYLIRSKKGF